MANSRWVGAVWVAVSAVAFGAMAIFARVAFAGGADVLAAVFLGEPIGGLQALGGAIVLGAVIALARGDAPQAEPGSGATSSR